MIKALIIDDEPLAHELNVLDYLVKPFSLSRFIISIQKAEHQLALHRTVEAEDKNQSIFIKSNKKIVQIKFNEINYVEGLGDYIIGHSYRANFFTRINQHTI